MAEDNGILLRELWKNSGLTQWKFLELFNVGQAKPMALRTLKTYLAKPESSTKVSCPVAVLERFRVVLKDV